MTIAEAPPAAPVPTEPAPSSFGRIFGVLFSPNETFASIARRPTWVAPLVLLLLVSLGFGLTMATRVDFAAAAREAIAQNKNMTAQQAETAERWSTGIGKVVSYAAPVIALISYLLIALVLWLAFRLFGGEGNFAQAFSTTLYAWIPATIKAVLMIILMLVKPAQLSAADLPILVRSNPAFLVSMKSNPLLFALLGNLDVFGLWTLILFIIGFAYVARVSKAKSAAVIIPIRIVVALFGLIGPAMQSLRK